MIFQFLNCIDDESKIKEEKRRKNEKILIDVSEIRFNTDDLHVLHRTAYTRRGMKRRGHSFARMSNASKEESSVTPLREQVVEDETFRLWKWRVDCVAAS